MGQGITPLEAHDTPLCFAVPLCGDAAGQEPLLLTWINFNPSMDM